MVLLSGSTFLRCRVFIVDAADVDRWEDEVDVDRWEDEVDDERWKDTVAFERSGMVSVERPRYG
jgi:hypothetical protein